MDKTQKKSENATADKSHKRANIIVAVVVGVAALILIAIAVLNIVRVNPTRDISKPKYYTLYDLGSTEQIASNSEVQSKIGVAVDDMQFSVMSAILQWQWDYSYNFKRNDAGEKIELDAAGVKDISATTSEYMVEFVYETVGIKDGAIDYASAQSLEVDGETVYFDRLKVRIGNTDGKVGTISLYPYLSVRINNESDVDGVSSDSYRVTGINVRANTSTAYNALKDLIAAVA